MTVLLSTHHPVTTDRPAVTGPVYAWVRELTPIRTDARGPNVWLRVGPPTAGAALMLGFESAAAARRFEAHVAAHRRRLEELESHQTTIRAVHPVYPRDLGVTAEYARCETCGWQGPERGPRTGEAEKDAREHRLARLQEVR